MIVEYMKKKMTRSRAIRAKCMDCTCEQLAEIKDCPVEACPLWPYRMGKLPSDKELQQSQDKISERWR